MRIESPRRTRRAVFLKALLGLCVPLSCLLDCSSPTTGVKQYANWSFSGYVIDGNSRLPLSGASISYFDKDGKQKTAATDSTGAFFIDELPFGDRSFSFAYSPADTSEPAFTARTLVVSSLNESRSIEGLMGDVSKVVRLYPLAGSVSGSVLIRRPGGASSVIAPIASLTVAYKDTEMANAAPAVFTASADSAGRFTVAGLPRAPGASLSVGNYSFNGVVYRCDAVVVQDLAASGAVDLGNVYLTAIDSSSAVMNAVRSNVMSADGFGLMGVPVTVHPWYILPVKLDSATVAAAIGAGRKCSARMSGDTVFLAPADQFPFDTLVEVTLSGEDGAGDRVELVFDGVRRFRTEKGVFPVASSAWKTAGIPVRPFKPGDTLWAAFSAPLDRDVNKIDWLKSTAQAAIYVKGAGANATAWTDAETLFVLPDQRLALDYGQQVGFKVRVATADGKRSDSVDFVTETLQDSYYVKWTSAKDPLGNMRRDFGVMESVVVVSSAPIAQVKGLSGMTGKTAPANLALGDLRVSGDTIVYRPSLYLAPDSTYGLDFDVLFADGTMRFDALGVTWKTRLHVQVLSVDNRVAGAFRRMKVIGDSVAVTFSEAIDTSIEAPVPFRAVMTNAHSKTVRTLTHWNAECTRATIVNIDTLLSADFNASPAYAAGAIATRSVLSLAFDLTTRAGERVTGFKPGGDPIELHTEPGLCPIASSVVRNHDEHDAINRTEDPVLDLDSAAAITVTFNRAIDTAAMKADSAGYAKFFGLRKSGALLSSQVSVSPDARTVTVRPDSALVPLAEYYLWCQNVPGLGIAGAREINRDAGMFSGKGPNGSILDQAFRRK